MGITTLVLSDGGSFETVTSFFESDSFTMLTQFPDESQEEALYRTLRSMGPPGSSPLLLLLDTITTTFNPPELTTILTMLSTKTQNGVVYLGRWGDRCYLHRTSGNKRYPSDTHRLKLVTVSSVGGFMAIYLSAEATKYLLDHQNDHDGNVSLQQYLRNLVETKKLKAGALIPNVFTYDHSNYATTRENYDRTNECVNVTMLKDSTSPNPQTYFYIAGIIGMVVILGYGLYLLGPKTTPSSDKGDED